MDYPAGLAEDLVTLEKEGAVYAQFVDPIQSDGTSGFRYYRIPLLPGEIFQFVEATVAHYEYERAIAIAGNGGGDNYLEVGLAGVSNRELADRVRRYDGFYVEDDGTKTDLRGCPASFFPDDLDALMCGNRRERYEELPEMGGTRDRIALVMQVLNTLPTAARILGDRQRSRPPFVIENEYDVQDLLFAILRSVFQGARKEESTPQCAGSAKRIDIVLPEAKVVVEAKYVRNDRHGRSVADELRVDFECYHTHACCEHVIALVWDPNQHPGPSTVQQ